MLAAANCSRCLHALCNVLHELRQRTASRAELVICWCIQLESHDDDDEASIEAHMQIVRRGNGNKQSTFVCSLKVNKKNLFVERRGNGNKQNEKRRQTKRARQADARRSRCRCRDGEDAAAAVRHVRTAGNIAIGSAPRALRTAL